ncbi:hypothetical protein N7448_003327 [Penicillium atrosanguineum]|uniref:RING-type domain-containing protein n=1 Tax=Penicillium atrosanguineum TaxID=1132637 RepID=A0A9W9PXM3_9EURO|nr:uncharacterized protein N7443_002296 [Penicillium atrosanguineum]KAJ5122194.1 hypothetical protein N7526_009131 [Penicillium atrosanguineum]KAJ5139919.1 hypothetical protein N7448_003327 [Penicillium atrosanguineum]KAJ5309835.1 hypothetical protein N7443_002296 [Penicillium atrosanguineum]KAJ5315354.1 hypothetical protein N7476_005661 [Penicillium atrosanguineum]
MSRRLSVVDLTSAHLRSERRSSASSARNHQPTPDQAGSPATPRGVKRRREDDGFWSPENSDSAQDGEQEYEDAVESIDLTEPESLLSKALAKQREDAIKAQQSTEGEKGSGSMLSAYKCPVCMDTPEDATSTSCGHLFCHRCIVEYLNSADQRLDSSKQVRGTCPICRKPITKVDVSGPKRSLIPLALKLTTKKRSLPSASQA